jgi:predicted nucleic acid-binding Zn ribbon protein
MRRPAPRGLDAALRTVTSAVAPPGTLAAVQREWAAAVGPAIAAEAQPAAERDGTLTVVCGSAVWAHELALLERSLVHRLNARIASTGGAAQAVRELRLRVES